MKKFKLFGVALMAVIFLASCGGGGGSKDEKVNVQIKPSKTKIKGKLSKFLEVVDGTFKISKGDGSFGGDYQILIKVKSIGTTTDQFDEIHGSNKGNYGGMTLAILDETGLPIGDLDKFKLHFGEKDKVIYLLENQGEEDFLKFTVDISYGTEIYENGLPDNISSFEVGSEVTDYVPSTSNNSTNNSSDVSNNSNITNSKISTSNENWDEILDKYEKFATDYIDYTKKIVALQKKGDDASLSEVASLMTKAMQLNQDASKLGTKLQNANNNLSSTQMTRYTKILTKFMQAASELSK